MTRPSAPTALRHLHVPRVAAFAAGPGAVSRFAIGPVIAVGLTVGALISLYVVPVVYSCIAVDKRQPQPVQTPSERGILNASMNANKESS